MLDDEPVKYVKYEPPVKVLSVMCKVSGVAVAYITA
jgi:hypothetical protein